MLKSGSKKFPRFLPPFRQFQGVPSIKIFNVKDIRGTLDHVGEVWLYIFVKTTKIQPDMVEVDVTVSSAITWPIQRGTWRSRTEAKHVLMFQRAGACYPDWIISAKGYVKYVTDNQ